MLIMDVFHLNIYDVNVSLIMYARILSDTHANVWLNKTAVSTKHQMLPGLTTVDNI